MEKRERPKRTHTFQAEVRRQFGRTAAAWGMSDPVEDDLVIPGIVFAGDRLTYDWTLDPREGDLSVAVRLVVTEGTLHAHVDDLVAGGGLGAARDVRRNARTWRSIYIAIASHVHWLERLHPVLTGPDAQRWMERAGALLSAPDLERDQQS